MNKKLNYRTCQMNSSDQHISTVQVDYRKFCHEQNFLHHVSNISHFKVCKVLECVKWSQGACHPWAFKDGQSQYYTASKIFTFLPDSELSDWAEGGNLPSWSKKQQVFSLIFYWLCFQKVLIGFQRKKLHFAQKLTTLLIFSHLYFRQISAIQIG